MAADFELKRIKLTTTLIKRVYQEFGLELQKRAWLRSLVDASGLDPGDRPALMRYLAGHYPKNQMG